MLPLFKVAMSEDVEIKVAQVLKSGFVSQGIKVEEFETKLKECFNYPYILTLNSATSGLTLALRLLNLAPHDKIITTPLTCTATNWPILANGCDIIWADIDPETCNISLTDLEVKLKTLMPKAIVIVHWGGSPVDLNQLTMILEEFEERRHYRPIVIEDCAHAYGATYGVSRIGTHGNICVFSLQAIKQLTSVDGGLIFLPNQQLYNRAKLLRWFGIDRDKRSGGGDFRLEPDIPEWGYKFHMNDLNATIGLANMTLAETNLVITRKICEKYQEAFKYLYNVKLLREAPNSRSAYWIFTIKVNDKPDFMEYMKTNNIMTSQVHSRNDRHSCVKQFQCDLPNLTALEKEMVAIPCGWWLTDDNVDYIIDCVKTWDKKIKIREVRNSDYNQYLKLLSQLTKIDYHLTKDEFRDKLQQIGKEGGKIYVLYHEYEKIYNMGDQDYVHHHELELLATAKLIIESKMADSIAHIEDVVTDSEHRRKGHGKMLIEYLIKKAGENSCYKVVLNSKVENDEFYVNCGFVSEQRQYVKRLK